MTQHPPSTPVRILLVDDNDHDAMAFRRAFSKSELGTEITRCAAAEEALQLLSKPEAGFHLAVIDQHLPHMNGLQLCREILSLGIELPLIFLTGAGSEGLAVEAFKAGAYDYLVKDAHQGYLSLLPLVAREVLRAFDDRRARHEATAALQKAKADLEIRVLERTAEIDATNRKLQAEIVERQQAQEKLGRSEAMLQAVFDGISDPLILLDRQMTVRMVNKAAARYYGFDTQPDALERQSCVVSSGGSTACEGCRIPEAVMKGERISYERTGLMDPSTIEKVVVYPLQNAGQDIGNAVVHVTDITEAKQIEKQMIQQEKLASLGMLVSSIAHEINNPNNFISFNIPILQDYLEEMLPLLEQCASERAGFEICGMSYPEFRKDILKLVDNIGHGADRIKTFVSNLREFSQFKDRRPKQWIDLGQAVERAFSICRNKIEHSVRTFVKDIPETLPRIYSEPHALEQILINLLVNAAQAADKQDSWIRLKVAVADSWEEHTIMEVSDNGKGIAPDMLDRIFDPFFTTKSNIEGTGLGLYVCRSLVTALGGRLEVESEPEKGSTFRVLLQNSEPRSEARQLQE